MMVEENKTSVEKELESVLDKVGEAAEKIEEKVVESVGEGLEGLENNEVKKTKKLEELKETPENKEAVAKAEGKTQEKGVGDKEKGKTESKPAVAKAGKVKKEKKVDAVELEREYIVPMRKGFMNVPHYRRAKKAVKTLKEFMVRHMNVRDGDTRKIKVDINLNNEIWFRGIKNPLHKIKVNAKKVDGLVYVTLADPAEYVKFAMARQEKRKAIQEKGIGNKEKGKPAKKEKVVADKDKDGVVDAVEEKEDAASEAEKDAKNAKVEAKVEKQTVKGEHKQKIASTKGLK